MLVYKIVQMVGGQMVTTTPSNIYAWAQSNGRSVYHPAVNRSVYHPAVNLYHPAVNLRLRPELQLQPRIQGFCGPMWDGEVNGVPVIRYEDSASNDILSK